MGKDKMEPSIAGPTQRVAGLLPRSALAAMVTVATLVVLSLFISPAAVAQEDDEAYVSVAEGELTLEASSLAPGAAVTVSGTGFASESSLRFVVSNLDSGTSVVSEELFADGSGAVSHSFNFPAEMVTADYLARISGLTGDGGTLLLEKVVRIDGNVEQLTTTTFVTTTTVAVDPTEGTEPQVGDPTPVEVENGATGATDVGAAEGSTRSAPLPTIDQLGDDGSNVAELAAGDDDSSASASSSSSSSGSSALVLIIVVAVVGALGAAGLLVRRRATKPF